MREQVVKNTREREREALKKVALISKKKLSPHGRRNPKQENSKQQLTRKAKNVVFFFFERTKSNIT